MSLVINHWSGQITVAFHFKALMSKKSTNLLGFILWGCLRCLVENLRDNPSDSVSKVVSQPTSPFLKPNCYWLKTKPIHNCIIVYCSTANYVNITRVDLNAFPKSHYVDQQSYPLPNGGHFETLSLCTSLCKLIEQKFSNYVWTRLRRVVLRLVSSRSTLSRCSSFP